MTQSLPEARPPDSSTKRQTSHGLAEQLMFGRESGRVLATVRAKTPEAELPVQVVGQVSSAEAHAPRSKT